MDLNFTRLNLIKIIPFLFLIEPSGFDLWFTWCQSCRHGGHAIHMLQWFEKHKVCPVSECTCECEITK